MGRKHMVGSIDRRGQQNQYLRRSWTFPIDLKGNEASFSTISMDMLYLRVAQTPRSPDPAIFVLRTTEARVRNERNLVHLPQKSSEITGNQQRNHMKSIKKSLEVDQKSDV